MKSYLTLFFLLVVSGVIAEEFEYTDPETAGFSKERLERISPVMQKYIDANLTPGVLTAIMREGKIVY